MSHSICSRISHRSVWKGARKWYDKLAIGKMEEDQKPTECELKNGLCVCVCVRMYGGGPD